MEQLKLLPYEHLSIPYAVPYAPLTLALDPPDEPVSMLNISEEPLTPSYCEETPLTCAVCQDTYSDPRILPCLHSFCKGCLSKLASISTAVKCPLCRNEHTLSPKGIDELLPNTQLARKVETSSTTKEKSKCDQCEETNVVSFCTNCESFLCEFCDKAHKKMGIFKSHVLVLPKLAKKNPKVEDFICPKHTSESLTVYCIDCKSVICRDCAIYDHNGHNFKPAVDASDEIRKSLVSDSKQLKTNLETFCSHAEMVAKVEKHVTIYPDTMKSFITSQFEEFHKLLDKRKEALLGEVDSQYNGFSKILWVEKDTVETGICKLEAGIKFAQQLAKSDDKLEVAVLGSKALASNQVAKTLSWDPKAIESLGPLAYAAKERHFDKDYIEEIGKIKNVEIVIKDGSYVGHRNSHDFQRNRKYCVEIAVKADHHFKVLFPQISLLCSCKRGSDAVSCTTECKQDKWEVTFQTKYEGTYTMQAVLRINGEDCCRRSKSITISYVDVSTISVISNSAPDFTPICRENESPSQNKLEMEPGDIQVDFQSSDEAHSSWTHSPSSVGIQSLSSVTTAQYSGSVTTAPYSGLVTTDVTNSPLQYWTTNSPSSMGMQSLTQPATVGYGTTSASMLIYDDYQHVPERNRVNISTFSRPSSSKKPTSFPMISSNRGNVLLNENKGRAKKKQYQ